MIAIDDILYELLRTQMDQIKADPSVLDLIFAGKTKESIEQVKKFILDNKAIKIVLHHPRVGAEFPCMAIVLEGSTESEQVMGAALYDEVLISSMEDGWIGSDSDIFREGVHWDIAKAKLVPDGYPNVFDPVDVAQFYSALEVKDGRRSCHMKGKQTTSLGKGIWIDFKNSVLQGGSVSLVGMDQVTFWIKSNRMGTFLEFGFGKKAHREHTFNIALTERKVWERVSLDISGVAGRDKDAIRYMSFKIVNADSPIDIFIDALKGEKQYGSTVNETFLDNRYRIETWTDNADLTLAYYSILLWTLLKYRDYLESSWDLMEQRIEGGDIMPQPEYYPEFLYVRGLMFSCKTIETTPRESDLVAWEIKVGKQDWGQGTSQ
jgi:hypothetical protein